MTSYSPASIRTSKKSKRTGHIVSGRPLLLSFTQNSTSRNFNAYFPGKEELKQLVLLFYALYFSTNTHLWLILFASEGSENDDDNELYDTEEEWDISLGLQDTFIGKDELQDIQKEANIMHIPKMVHKKTPTFAAHKSQEGSINAVVDGIGKMII